MKFRDRSQQNSPTAHNGRNRSGKAWLTLGTVAAYAAVSITRSIPAWAQNTDATAGKGKPQEQQGLMVRRLEIPAGPLGYNHQRL